MCLGVHPLELGDELGCDFLVINDDQVLVVSLLSAVCEVIRAEDDDTLIDDHHLVVHLAWIPIYGHIQPGLLERVKLGV